MENYTSSTVHPSQLSVSSCPHYFIRSFFVSNRQLIVILLDFLQLCGNPVLSPIAIHLNIPLFHLNVCSFDFSLEQVKHFSSSLISWVKYHVIGVKLFLYLFKLWFSFSEHYSLLSVSLFWALFLLGSGLW